MISTGNCTFAGCVWPIKAKGLCNAHYVQMAKGKPLTELKYNTSANISGDWKECTYEGCHRRYSCKGYCNGHYQQLVRGTELKPLGAQHRSHICQHTDCEAPRSREGWCLKHYERVISWGNPDTKPSKEINWSPWHVNAQGYVIRTKKIDGKRISQLQHRQMMEDKIGRPLLRHENVHHINGVRDDNRIENLELWSTLQPKGQRIEDKLAWATYIMELYGSQ